MIIKIGLMKLMNWNFLIGFLLLISATTTWGQCSGAITANIASSTDVLCLGNDTGTATVAGVGGNGGPYTFQWDAAAMNQTTATATGLPVGTYFVTVTDPSGPCQDVTSVNITQPATAISASTSVNSSYNGADISCNGAGDGVATVTAVGGTITSSYSYLWGTTPMQSTAIATGLSTGVYSVSVWDDNGCSTTSSVTLTEPSAVTASIVTTDVTCKGGSDGTLTVTASGGNPNYYYLWSNGETTATIANLFEGSYSVTAIDVNTCIGALSTQVDAINEAYINKPILLGGGAPQIFVGDSYLIDGYSSDPTNMTYAWSPATGLSCASCLDPMVSPAATTTYHLTATHNSAGCVFQDSITIEVYPNDPTDTVYVGIEPDSIFNACVTLPSFISGTQGSFGHMGASLSGSLFTPLYGCYRYTAGSTPNVVDTLVLVACEQLCDTTIVIISTGTCVWAGDANDDQVANNLDLLPIGLHYGATGQIRPNASLSYTCQPNIDWGQGITGQSGTDIKHIDTDGNGLINNDDTLAISQNWGQIHLRGGHGFLAGPPMFVDTVVANPGDTLALPIMLGDLANVVTGAYGLAFTINYDSTNIKAGSVSLGFDNSWMGNGTNTISIQKDFHALGRVEAALTRIDQTPMTGSGQIGTLYLTIKDVVLPNRSWTSAVRLDFEVSNVTLIDNLGNLMPVDPKLTQVLVLDPATGSLVLETAKEEISIRPNPASFHLDINTKGEGIEKVGIYTLDGRLVKQELGTTSTLNLDLGELSDGLYILSVQTEKGVHSKQLIIQK